MSRKTEVYNYGPYNRPLGNYEDFCDWLDERRRKAMKSCTRQQRVIQARKKYSH